MSREARSLLLEPPGTETPPELPPVLSPLPPVVLPELLLVSEPEPPLELLLELELWPPPQLPPWEPRAPVSATTAMPKTATARTWRSFTFNPR
ncbi:hypothetical protein ACF068_17335 [Streptomyces sp. NPDC016309]|uniref:hypothetical protein n=1 Tax=Streptomyces sp. NPDC016309 TaxID=3364965 RepID=UPI0036FB3697